VRHNVEVGAGWVDSDYRGELKVELKNLGLKAFTIEPGMRIAQIVVLQTGDLRVRKRRRLPPSARGTRGFGSTGTS
jgi:dUTP pyrophosphatase